MADPALGLKMKLEVDDSSIPADIARAKRKVEAAGAARDEAPLAMPEGPESYGQMLERKRVELIKAERAKNEEIRAEQERINELLAKDVEEHEAIVARKRRKAREQQIAEERAASERQIAQSRAAAAQRAAADAQRAEAAAMRQIGRETGGPTPGEINARTAAYARMDDSLKGVRKRFTDSAQEGMKWLGVAGLIGGTAATFFALGQTIRSAIEDALKSATDRANEFRDSLDFSDVGNALKKTDDELAKLESTLAARQDAREKDVVARAIVASDRLKKSDEELQEEINQKRALRQSLFDAAEAKKRSDQREKDKADAQAKDKEQAEAKRRMQIEQRKKEIEDGKRFGEEAFQTEQDNLMGSLSEREQIIAEAAAKKRELEKKYNELGYKEAIANEDAFKRAREAINIERNRRIRELDEEQIKSAARVQQAWTNAFRAIRDENNKAFATDQAASMVQFAQQLRVEGMVAQAGMNRIVVEGVQ